MFWRVRSIRWASALALYVLLVLLLTLLPLGPDASGDLSGCLICGDRGVADALLNVILFAPLGAILRVGGSATWRVLLLSACLSLLVELSQYFLPGRDPSAGDFLFNTMGGGVGAEAARFVSAFMYATGGRAGRLAIASGLAAISVWLATAYLLEPAFPTVPYWGQFTPELGGYDHYRGKVLEADVDGLPVVYGELEHSDSIRDLLVSGTTLTSRFVAGSRSDYVAPIVRIHHAWTEDAAMIAADRLDFVYKYRTRGATLRLDQPDLRNEEVFRVVSTGDTVEASVTRESDSYVLRVADTATPPLGFTIGHGWALLMYVEEFPPWMKKAANSVWIALLLLPVGYWALRRWETVVTGLIIVGGMTLVPVATLLQATRPVEYLGAAVGVALGRALREIVCRMSVRA